MAIADLIPTFDLLQLLLVGFAFFLGSLMMHLIAAKVVYSHPKFLNKVAVGVMSSAFVQMTQGKILKKVVSGITEALSKVKVPSIGDMMDSLPPDVIEKLPSGILEKVKGGEISDLSSLTDMVGGLMGGKKSGGGLEDILSMFQMLSKFGKGGGSVESTSSGSYSPGK